MLWLCIYLPRLSLEALAPPEEIPTVVIAQEKNVRRIIACNDAAIKAGVNNTTGLVTAQAICAELRVLERNVKAEHTALQRLAAWSYQWSSHVTWQEAQPRIQQTQVNKLVRNASVWLEIGASLQLFGGPQALIEKLEAALQLLHYTYCLGIAPTVEGAALLARAGKRVIVTSPTNLLAAIRKLDIAQLALSHNILEALRLSGIADIATLLDLPSASVARRFGPQTTLYLDRLCGRAPDPRPLYKLPKRYRERCEFGFGINNTEALLFPLRRLLHEFCGYLRAVDIATQRCVLILEHEQRATTHIVIGLAAPSRDAGRLFALVKEKLHNVILKASVYGVRLQADEFTDPVVRQNNLFTSVTETTEELQQVLEKITARLGESVVQTLRTVADHRPEHAWAFSTSSTAHIQPETLSARPLWLLAKPHRLSSPPKINAQPERIEGSWWEAPITRDYFSVRSVSGACFWIFFDRSDQHWYVHGYWA